MPKRLFRSYVLPAALCALASGGSTAPAERATDALAFYNAAGVDEAQLLAGFRADDLIPLNRVALNGWGFPSLVREASARPGVLAAFEDAAPLGFSRADVDAAVLVAVRKLPGGRGWLSGVLGPTDLRFRHEIEPDAEGRIRIPVPAGCLAPGDYTLKLCLRAGEVTDCAELPLTIGPYLQRDRFHTYSWNAGGSNEAHLAAQIKLARLVGADVLDTAYLPATTALKEGLFVSAHYVTIHQGDVADGHAAVPPYFDMAQAQAEAIGDMARRYCHLLWCLPNSEYGSDRMLRLPAYEAAMRAEAGVGFADLDLDTTDYPIPSKALPQLSPGVYSRTLPELAAHRFARRHGMGWFELNRRSMAPMRERAPWLTMWTDPVFANEQFEGFDAVSFWHYENDPYQTVAWTQRAECARRLNGARQVFLTLSQWYSGIAGAKDGWGLRSPDQHRFNGWLALTLPVHALGYWELGELERNPDCAAGLRDSLSEVVYPYGTLLSGTSIPPAPVALYVSTAGEFLSRANRPHNFWFQTHYLNGVLPALFERFHGRLDWIDDGDVLAGRLGQYRLVLCPLFAATTDELLSKLQEYQAAGGLLAGDELWAVEALAPALRFPGRSTEALGLPYANESLAAWHRANREAILQWQPEEVPPLADLLDVCTSTPDTFAALREAGGVRFAVVANGRFRQGEFAKRHGYTAESYLDEGVAQETDLLVEAPAASVVYDVVRSRRLAPAECTPAGDRVKLHVTLTPAGGAIFAFHPRPVARVRLDRGTDGPAWPGTVVPLTVTVLDDQGGPIAGPTAIRLRVADAQGVGQDVSGVHRAPNGVAHVPFGIPVSAQPGTWVIEVRDLTSGAGARMEFAVVQRPTQAGR